MSKIIKIRKGLDIKLNGQAAKTLQTVDQTALFAIKPSDFPGLTPKLNVKVGFEVKAGSPLFHNKYNPELLFCSPVSGIVKAINRGERRRILEVVVESDGKNLVEEFTKGDPASLSKEDIKTNLLKGGVWPFIRQRPFGIVANPEETPKSIYISGFDSAPLAPDMDFILNGQESLFQKGVDALAKLTDGKIHLNLKEGNNSPLQKIKNVEFAEFSGPHPAGNVGIQIHHLTPLNKGEVIWYINPQDVLMIGRLFENGVFDASRIVALAGSEIKNPQYYKSMLGSSIANLIKDNHSDKEIRFISGNVLTGTKIPANGYIGFYDSMITAIPEGNHFEFFGWAMPGLKKFSNSKSFFSWLTPNKKYSLDTNFNGGPRGFVMSEEYEKVLPMDILPVHLLKSIMINDIDAMEQLGIYEVVEEDLALCEYVCTSKTEVQTVLREGIDNLIKELG